MFFKIAKIVGITLLTVCVAITGILHFFKQDLINYAVGKVNGELKAKVLVEKIDIAFWGSFPSVAIDFDKVFIQDTYENSKSIDTLFYSNKIRLKFNLWDVWNKTYKVKALEFKTGKVYIKYNEKGEQNFDILKEKTDSTKSAPFNLALKSVTLENMRFSYQDKKNDQLYKNHFDLLTLSGIFSDDIFTLKAKSTSFLHTAKSGNLNLLKNIPLSFDIACEVNKTSKSISFPSSSVLLAKIPLKFQGVVDTNKIDFQLSGKSLPFQEVVSKLNLAQTKEIKTFNGTGSVDFNLLIKGNTQGKNRAPLQCAIQVKNGALQDPSSGLRLNDVQLSLNYNSNGNASKDKLNIKKLHFQSLKGIFDASFMVETFNAPHITGEAKGSLDLGVIQTFFPLTDIQKTNGTVTLDGKADLQMNSSKGINIKSGEVDVQLSNVLLQRKHDLRIFENINGNIAFAAAETLLKDVSVKINRTDLVITGALKNLVGYAKNVENLNGELTVQSNAIDANDLINTQAINDANQNNERHWTLPDNIRASVLVNLKKLLYQGHIFNNISSNLVVGNRILDFQQFAANNGGSSVTGRVAVHENTPENFIVKTNLSSNAIKFKELFQEWNNFDQKTITAENISGSIEAKLVLEAPFDGRTGIMKHLIKADVSLNVKNGRLYNVKTFKDIIQDLKTSKAKLILSKKSINALESKLQDIKFQTLENKFTIRDGVLQFPKMEIKSDAINVNVAGVHSFDNEMDYRFDFGYRDLTYANDSEFGTIEDDGTGFKIFMRMHGNALSPIIEWDKEAKKADAKQNRQDALTDAKSIFKTEFGIGKKDTTIRDYKPKPRIREDIIIEYDTKEENPKETTKEKENKLLKKLKDKTNKWKDIKKKEEENDFEIDI